MILDTIQQVNWVDLVMGVLLARALFVGLKRGFIDEALHLIGVVITIYIVFHYYPLISGFLENRIGFQQATANAIAYLTLWGIVTLISKLVREGLHLLLRVEAHSFINRIGGLLLATARGVLVCSLVSWFLVLGGNEYVKKNTHDSLGAPLTLQFASKTYKGIFNGLIVKYFPREKLNTDVLVRNRD